MARDPLETYRSKRNAERSGEPRGDKSKRRSGASRIFVIQQHDASSLHYDFRLEIGGVLKSWAVPKGPSTDPRDKRLAIETEDHPLDYADFEGVIPDNEYGGGTVQVWDRGTFANLKVDADGNVDKSLQTAFEDGHVTVWLDGEKLSGGYSLTHFRTENQKRQWLLVKMDDDKADARRNPVRTETRSVLSERTTGEIARDNGEPGSRPGDT